MRREVVASSLLVACGFTPGPAAKEPGTTADAGAPPILTADSGVLRSHCHVGDGDTQLHLCLDFEDAPLVAVTSDNSPYHHDATVDNVTTITRSVQQTVVVQQQAVSMTSTSSIFVQPTPDLALTGPLTVEAWIKTQSSPLGGFVFVVSNGDHYALGIDDAGELACFIGATPVPSSHGVDDNKWHHVACTYDASSQEGRIYIDGSIAKCFTVPPPTSTISNLTVIGGAYHGAVDDVHIYARVLAGSEVCSHANKTNCSQSCG